jgi:hypothetical protein
MIGIKLSYTAAEVDAALASAIAGGGGERRHEFASPYSYCGTAPTDTLDSAETWTLTRITLDATGTVIATETATDAWDNRATATYA